MASIELKPCLFCDSTDVQVYLAFGFYAARCMGCRCQGPGYSCDTPDGRQLAGHAWNTRIEHKRLAELEAFAELLNPNTLQHLEDQLADAAKIPHEHVDALMLNESIELVRKAKVLI